MDSQDSLSSPQEVAAKELDRAVDLYSICLRDYFSTFGTYTTATSILVAGLGFLSRGNQPQQLILVVSFCGLILCWQWHVSTATMRDQYRHFRDRIVELERAAGIRLMGRWLRCAAQGRGRALAGLLPEEQRDAERDAERLSKAFRRLDRRSALRGAMLPVIYSAVFVAVIASSLLTYLLIYLGCATTLSFAPLPLDAERANWAALAIAAAWLWILTQRIHRGRQQKHEERPAPRRNTQDVSLQGSDGVARPAAALAMAAAWLWILTLRIHRGRK